uniref:Uncharacterized protein n=1 Tax=Cacopsylla melanoneura TaxID=428564 RepID=A0A8D9ALN0_9HEMI
MSNVKCILQIKKKKKKKKKKILSLFTDRIRKVISETKLCLKVGPLKPDLTNLFCNLALELEYFICLGSLVGGALPTSLITPPYQKKLEKCFWIFHYQFFLSRKLNYIPVTQNAGLYLQH